MERVSPWLILRTEPTFASCTALPVGVASTDGSASTQIYFMNYTLAFERSWAMLKDWVAAGKFTPRNEEDIQCFLYHGIVVELGTAIGVRTKASSGNLWLGSKHYPDLVLGQDAADPELIIEIKYQPLGRKAIYNGCKLDIAKMKKYYDSRPHRFVLFDECPYFVFLDQHQYDELSAMASSNCQILHFPTAFNPSSSKATARTAVETMRKAGKDFHQMGMQAGTTTKKQRSGGDQTDS